MCAAYGNEGGVAGVFGADTAVADCGGDCRRIEAERHVAATGQWGSCALVLAAIVQQRLGRPLLIVTAHLDEADDAVDQLHFFRKAKGETGEATDVRLYPAFEVLPGESNVSHELASQRLELLVDLAKGNGGSEPGRDDGTPNFSDTIFVAGAGVDAAVAGVRTAEGVGAVGAAGDDVGSGHAGEVAGGSWVYAVGRGGGCGGFRGARGYCGCVVARGGGEMEGVIRRGLIFLAIRWSWFTILILRALVRRGMWRRLGWWRWGIARRGRLIRRRVY